MSSKLHPREGWLSVLLLFLLLFTVSLSLQAADWTPGLNILNGVVLVAFIVGVFFAKSRLSGLLMNPLALALGVGWIGFLALGQAAEAPWEDQLAEVISRLVWWWRGVAAGEPNGDTLAFVLLMAGLVWLLVYGAAWSYYRDHSIWGVLLPSGVTILVNTYYARGDLNWLLVIFLVLAFLLILRANLFEKEERWRQEGVAYSADIHFDFLREGAIFAVAVVMLTWLMPNVIEASPLNPLLTRLGEPWGRAQQQWTRVFSTLNYRGTSGGTWFGRSMSFRGPINLSDTLVMRVRAPQGRYWRAVVFDRYTSAGWTVSDQKVVDGPEGGQPLVAPLSSEEEDPGRQAVGQQFTVFVPAGTLLFAAGQPVQVSLPLKVMLGGPTASAETVTRDNVAQLYARQPLLAGQTYSAVSAIPTVAVESLRLAGTAYPAGLAEAYTQLPETVTPRVRELAQTLAANSPSAYDTARTIEQYLRALPYNELIPGPNPGEDGVDYFLFRERQGYCDYYASAMAVMLRSLGIPARVAQGYSQGTPLPSGEFEVRQTNAHTWVEVYFPTYGWIEFEPTAAEPALERPAAAPLDLGEDDALVPGATPVLPSQEPLEALEANDERAAGAPTGGGGLRIRLDPRALAAPIGLLAAIALVAMVGRVAMQRRWRGLGPVERVYDQVGLVGRVLGQRVDPTLTPREYAARIGEAVPPARSPLARLAELFAKQRFGAAPLAPDEVGEAEQSWLAARRALLSRALRSLAPKKRAAPPPDRKDFFNR